MDDSNSTSKPVADPPCTDDQRKAIETVGTSVLVSAAAGSGKTSVLAARCVHLLCDAERPCEVGDLLVVTFTEAAAAEMKARIGKSLSARHLANPSPRTARHLAMLDRASIGTVHSFCARVLRQNFHLLGIDPEFKILDSDEAKLLKLDVATDLFTDRFDDPSDDDFRKTIDCYGDGDDERLKRQMIRAYDTLCSVVDPPQWLRNARRRIEDAIDFPLDQSELGQAYLNTIRSDLSAVMRQCHVAGLAVKALAKFPAYVAELRDIYGILKHWRKVLDSHGIDGLADVAGTVQFDRLEAVSNSVENKEFAKSKVDLVRKELKCGQWRQNLRFTTDEWKEGLRLTLGHVDVFLSLVNDFADKYAKAKDEQGILDFSDLEQLTLKCLKQDNSAQPSELALRFHHEFKHVLVDEYQDINQVQDAILSLVSRECLGAGSNLPMNLFCVGDVKQSIYRFRLAEAKQFLDKRDRFNAQGSIGKLIDLQANFRSRPPLLEAINSIFEKLMTRDSADLDYDKSQRLTAGKTFPEFTDGFTGSPIELHLVLRGPASTPIEGEGEEVDLDQIEREAMVLGMRILEMMGQAGKPARQVTDRPGTGKESRPIRFGDIVILLRAMRFKADPYAAKLRQMGVPVHTDSSTGYFESTEVNDILSLLHVLDNQRQDIPLAALLRSPISRLENAEENLTRIRLAYGGEPPVPFHLAVQKYAEEQAGDLAVFLRAFLKQLQIWRHEARQRPVAELLWSIYHQTGYLTYVSGLPNGVQRQANLIELHDRARQFGTFERQGLGRFLVFLEKLKNESDLGQAPIASQADDVVRIMSIHGSKGQEFPVVFVPDLGKAINLRDCQGTIVLDREAGLGMQVIDERKQICYPSLASTVVHQRLKQQAMAEELRVLYVAMTRAKEHLILTGSCLEAKVADWPEAWAGHQGPFPAEAVLCAHTPLDWLGPVASLLEKQIRVQVHTPDDLAAGAGKLAMPPVVTPAQLALFHRKPIIPSPPMTPQAQAVIDRLSRSYGHRGVADLGAAASVTSLVKKSVVKSNDPLPSAALDRVLKLPDFLAGKMPLDAADKGTATHAVLEHFDFKPDARSLEDQIQQLIKTRRLTPELAAVVDTEALRWFLHSPIGTLIARHAGDLKRELPIYYANPSKTAVDAMDQQMIRGRIDLLLPADGGWMMVDYKTDRVAGPALDESVALYTAQLEIYRQAVEQITGKPVVESVLVFLTPREIRRV